MANNIPVSDCFKTVNPLSTYVFKWTIENFSKINCALQLRSPEFCPLLDTRWYALLKRERIYNINTCDYIILNFCTSSSFDHIQVKLDIKLLNINDEPYKEVYDALPETLFPETAIAKFKISIGTGISFMGSYNNFNQQHFPKDIVILSCKLTFVNYNISTDYCDRALRSYSTDCMNTLSSDLRKIYESAAGADITLKVKECNFPVHKAILISRSEVFCKMFVTDMKEKATNIIEINDVEPCVMRLFLEYLYSGVCPNTEFSSAQSLYRVADKYCVIALKKSLTNSLLNKITVENAVEMLLFAHFNKENCLKEHVIAFIKIHGKEFSIVDTVRKIVNDKCCDSDLLTVIKTLL